MSINIGIIDQRVRKLAVDLAAEFETRLNIKNDEVKQRSTAFVFLVVKTVLDLSDEEALDCLTEGGNDFGLDAVHIGDVEDGEFVVTLFQGKYTHNLDKAGASNFPENAIVRMIGTIRHLFDPDAALDVNDAVKKQMEEIRSLVRDGSLPQVQVILCNNGLSWPEGAQKLIDVEKFGDQVVWRHVNHDSLTQIMQAVKPINDTLRLTGDAIIESFDFCRVLVGKVLVKEIEALFNRNPGDRLLERNIRRFLGLQGNRVNQAIAETLKAEADRANFYFFNNGITIVCRKFAHSGLQKGNYTVQVEGMQVINGGQTCKTIQNTLASLAGAEDGLEKAFVLVRLYELPSEAADLVRSITYATNSQNPVDLRDLRSNDAKQKSLETAIRDLGYAYRRHRSDASLSPTDISSGTAAEAVLSVWRHRPHQAKFMGREHFGKLYDTIFSNDLNGAQVVIATLLFRIAENKRRRPPEGAPDFVAYGSCFFAMLMGHTLLKDLGVELAQLDHRKFPEAKAKLDQNEEQYFVSATEQIAKALKKLYGEQTISLQRLAATFRRGDLIEELGLHQ
jgi:hypothetical protein